MYESNYALLHGLGYCNTAEQHDVCCRSRVINPLVHWRCSCNLL